MSKTVEQAENIWRKTTFADKTMMKDSVADTIMHLFLSSIKHNYFPFATHLSDKLGILQSMIMSDPDESDQSGPESPASTSYQDAQQEQLEDEQIPADMHTCGLDNPTSSICYFNTGLQCLNACVPLKNFILSGEYHNRLPSEESSFLPFLQAFEHQIDHMQTREKTSTYWLRELFNKLHPEFAPTNQHHDCHEMLMATITNLHEGFNRPTEGPDRPPSKAPMIQACQEWKFLRSRNQSPIFDIFFGLTKSTLTCVKCHRVSSNFSLFNSLQLSIPGEVDRSTLADCLALNFQDEQMDGPRCPKCESQECTKRTEIQQLPQVLIISFTRMNATEKIDTHIDYPLTDLNMAEWCDQVCLHRTDPYRLTAVATHTGSLRSGHNTAIVKHPTLSNWYEFSDERITPRSLQQVVTTNAYVLIYQR